MCVAELTRTVKSLERVSGTTKLNEIYVVGLWLIGVCLVAFGWYVPGAVGIAYLGGLTLAFGALMAFKRT